MHMHIHMGMDHAGPHIHLCMHPVQYQWHPYNLPLDDAELPYSMHMYVHINYSTCRQDENVAEWCRSHGIVRYRYTACVPEMFSSSRREGIHPPTCRLRKPGVPDSQRHEDHQKANSKETHRHEQKVSDLPTPLFFICIYLVSFVCFFLIFLFFVFVFVFLLYFFLSFSSSRYGVYHDSSTHTLHCTVQPNQ